MSDQYFVELLSQLVHQQPPAADELAPDVRSPAGVADVEAFLAAATDAGRFAGGPMVRALISHPEEVVDAVKATLVRSKGKSYRLTDLSGAAAVLAASERVVADSVREGRPGAEDLASRWVALAIAPAESEDHPADMLGLGQSLHRSALASASTRLLNANEPFLDYLVCGAGEDIDAQRLSNPAELTFHGRRAGGDVDEWLVDAASGAAVFYLVAAGRSAAILQVQPRVAEPVPSGGKVGISLRLIGARNQEDRDKILAWARSGVISVQASKFNQRAKQSGLAYTNQDLANAIVGVHTIRTTWPNTQEPLQRRPNPAAQPSGGMSM